MRVKVNSDVIAAVLFCAAGFAAIWAAISSAECKALAVSWKGSLCVRPVRDLGASARWIHKGKVPMRVREITTQTLEA